MTKKSDLDPTTQAIVKRVLAMAPKPHDEMKIGRTKKKTKRGPKDHASSAKRRTA
jgi:hypothetical protein